MSDFISTFYLTFLYYTSHWKHLKYQWDKNLKKKENTDNTPLLAEVILYKIHCQTTSFCYSIIQLGSISVIISDSKERHYISSLYEREREGKGEKCITTWKRRETRNAKVKYHLNSAEWVVTMGIFFAYILLKIINSNLVIFSRTPSMQTEGKHPPQSHLKKTKSHVFYFLSIRMNTRKYWSVCAWSVSECFVGL